MTRHRAGSINDVPFAIDRDKAGAERAYVCLDCGMETAPSTAGFMREHGSKCKPVKEEKETAASKKVKPTEKKK